MLILLTYVILLHTMINLWNTGCDPSLFLMVINLTCETHKIGSISTDSFAIYLGRESNSDHMFKRVIYHLDQLKSTVGYPF